MDPHLDKPPSPAQAAAWIGAALLTMILAAHAAYYLPYFEDDAFISLRYADRLLQGHGLTWTDGRPVEGYSNLLWILLIAAVGRCGLDLVLGARLLGLMCMALTLGVVIHAASASPGRRTLPSMAGGLTLVLAGPIAVWTLGGLEQPLVAMLLAGATVLSLRVLEADRVTFRQVLPASVCLALLCLARPDGPLFTATTLLAVLLVKGARVGTLRLIPALVALPILFCLGQLAFRLGYYGEWLPNTALVKLTPSAQHLSRGIAYVREGIVSLMPISAAALIFTILGLFSRQRRAVYILLGLHGVAWAAYVACIGGDIFPARRHFVPIVVLMALAVAEGMTGLLRRANQRSVVVAVMFLTAGAFAWYGHRQFSDAKNRWAKDSCWPWDGEVIGRMLKRGFGDRRPVHAVTAAGALPYFSGLPAIDMLGLNDHHLPRHPPEGIGRGFLGHELADGRYVLGRKPDMIIFRGPRGKEKGVFLSGRQVSQHPTFRDNYTLVTFEGREPYVCRSLIWVRRFSEKIGINVTESEINVPGFLLSGNPKSAAYLDASGRFVTAAARDRPARLNDLTLPPGIWRIEAEASGPVKLDVQPSQEEGKVLYRADRRELEMNGNVPVRIDITIEPIGMDAAEVREIMLRRSSSPPSVARPSVLSRGRLKALVQRHALRNLKKARMLPPIGRLVHRVHRAARRTLRPGVLPPEKFARSFPSRGGTVLTGRMGYFCGRPVAMRRAGL